MINQISGHCDLVLPSQEGRWLQDVFMYFVHLFWSVCFFPMHTLSYPTYTWDVSNQLSLTARRFGGILRLTMVTRRGGWWEDRSGVKEARPLRAEPLISLPRVRVSNCWECKSAHWCSGRGQATLSNRDVSREDPWVHQVEAVWTHLHCFLGFPLTICIYWLILTTEAHMYDESVHR